MLVDSLIWWTSEDFKQQVQYNFISRVSKKKLYMKTLFELLEDREIVFEVGKTIYICIQDQYVFDWNILHSNYILAIYTRH